MVRLPKQHIAQGDGPGHAHPRRDIEVLHPAILPHFADTSFALGTTGVLSFPCPLWQIKLIFHFRGSAALHVGPWGDT